MHKNPNNRAKPKAFYPVATALQYQNDFPSISTPAFTMRTPGFRNIHRFQKRLLTIAIHSALLLGAGTSHADSWNAGTGDWFVDGNWADGSAPIVIDGVGIDNGGTAQVQVPGARAANINVGNTNGNSGTLQILSGGTVGSSNGVIGNIAGSTGIATVNGTGSTWTSSGTLSVGRSGNGTLNIQNGGSVSNSFSSFIGESVGSTGTVTVEDAGSTWTSVNFFHVGSNGNGTLNIRNGGSVSNINASLIGANASSTGTVTVEDAGSTWTNSSTLSVGGSGNGTLNIQNGGSVSSVLGNIGEGVGSTGTVTVDGAGSTWINSGDMTVGLSGNGTLNIQNGGSVSAVLVQLGLLGGSSGTLNIGTGGAAGILNSPSVIDGTGTGTLNFNHTDGNYFFTSNGASGGASIGILRSITLNHIGSGTTTLTGSNTYTGATTISDGELIFDGGISTIGSITAAGGDMVIQNGAVVHNDIGFIGRDGIGSAIATVTGTGSVWNPTGDIAVSEFDGGFPLSGSGGTLRVENGGQVNAGGELFVDYAGVLEIDSSSQVTAANDLRVFAGTIRALSAGSLNIPDITVTTGANIDTNGFDVTYAGSATTGGIAGLTKIGAGTLTLTGNHANSDLGATVQNGTLLINGTFAGDAFVSTNGTLGGTGTVGSVTINGGTLAPGNSIGTLNVAGNVDFSGGGIYEVEVDAAGNSDLINATGTATLTNGSVSVLPEAGNYNISTDYTILTAAGGLGGTTFNSVSSNLAFLTPTLSYDANNVFLNLVRNDVSFSAVAGTPNQVAVGTAINTLSNTNSEGIQEILDNLFILTADGANQAYDSLSGVQHTHSNHIALQSINQFKGLLFDRIQGNNQFLAHDGKLMLAYNESDTMTDGGNQLLDGNMSPQRGWWLRGTGNYGDIDDTRNASGAQYKAGGIAAGLDFDLTPDFTAGAAVGYTRTDADVANGGLDVDTYQAALYGRLTLKDDYYLSGMTGVGFHNMDSNRSVTVGLLSNTAKADYDAWTGNIAIEAGRKFTLNANTDTNTSITPFAGLEYAHINRDSFTERDGGVTNLRVNEDTQDSLRSSLGARITHSWTTKGTRITPTAELAWIHEFMEDEASIRAGFATAPTTTFSVDGPELDRDRARLALGLNVQLSKTAHLNLGYQGEFASSDERHDIAATFRMVW